MKRVAYTRAAAGDLRGYRADMDRIMAKIERYAATGEGDTKALKGSASLRLRVGAFRVIFEVTADAIIVTKVGPRGDIYD